MMSAYTEHGVPIPWYHSTKKHVKSCMHINDVVLRILHEYYTCSQNLDILYVVEELTRHRLNCAILSKEPRQTWPRLLLGRVLSDKYDRTSQLGDISEAIVVLRAALVTDTDCQATPEIRIALSQALYKRFHATEDVEDIRATIDTLNDVLKHSTPNESQRSLAITLLALMKSHRLVMEKLNLGTEDLPMIEQSLRNIDHTCISPGYRPLYSLAHSNISFLHLIGTQDLKHAREGIHACTAVLHDHQVTPAIRAQARFGLTQILLLRGRLTAKKLDILDALANAELAVTEIERFHTSPHTLAYALFDWARCKVYGADDLEAISDLESAAATLRRALAICPDPHYNRILIVETLFLALGQCSRLGGLVAPLDEILNLRGYNEDYIRTRPFFATHLAEAMILRAHTTPPAISRSLLTRTISMLQDRMDYYQSRPQDGQTWEKTELNTKIIRAGLLFNDFGGPPSTISLGNLIRLGREAVQYSVAAHGPTVDLLLCKLLLLQAVEHNSLVQVTEVDAIIKKVATLETTDRICLAHIAAIKALLLTTRARLEGNKMLLVQAWIKYEEAVDDPVSRPRDRFTVAIRWAKSAKDSHELLVAFNAYSRAVGVLPYVTCLGDDEFGRLEVLRQINGFASAAATLALAIGRVDSAVEMLEQTRGIYWSQFYKLRPPTHELPTDLRVRWDDATRSLSVAELTPTQRRERSNELDLLLQQIRSTPGCDRFLLPPTIGEIIRMAQDLQVIVAMVVPGETYSNAIIIGGSHGAQHIPLRYLTTTRTKNLVQRMGLLQREVGGLARQTRKVHLASTPSYDHPPSDGILEILAELWTTLAQPIVETLGFQSKRGASRRERRRLIWCPVGALTQLPLHAAGIYDNSSYPNTISDYVVSSYTPTLAALNRAWTHRRDSSLVEYPLPSVLAVAQAPCTTTSSLPMAQVEVEAIQHILPEDQVIKPPGGACSLSVSAALGYLPSVKVLHLACHGHQNQDDALNSGFELEDGRLTIGQLMKMDIPNAKLAYLSACETASSDETRPDEHINLAATMMFVGFKSVIATMWAMDDVDGPFVAKRIYDTIFKDGHFDLGTVPWAIDDAVRELRESGVPASRWATFVHYGM